MNKEIISEFEKLVNFIQNQYDDSLLEKNKVDSNKHSFRLRQIKNVLKILKKYDKTISLDNIDELIQVKGIGKNSIKRVEEILNNGYLEELSDFVDDKATRKTALKELQEVIGVGKTNAIDFIDNYKIFSVKDLIKKHKNKEITLNEKILLGLKYYNVVHKNIPRKEIDEIFYFLKRVIKKMNRQYNFNDDNKLCIQICGSYRREKPLSNDIDVLLTKFNSKSTDNIDYSEFLSKFVNKLKKPRRQNNDKPFLIDDMTDKNKSKKYMGFCKFKDNYVRRIDIIFVPYDSYYPALLYFTGSKDLNQLMRGKAKKLGYKLNESFLLSSDKKKIKINSEKDIFKKLDMEYIEPKFR